MPVMAPFQLTEKVKSDLPEVKNMARLVSIGRANISTAENATAFYEDYREVGGVKWPFKTRAKSPAFELTFVLSEIRYDVSIEDSKFKRPN